MNSILEDLRENLRKDIAEIISEATDIPTGEIDPNASLANYPGMKAENFDDVAIAIEKKYCIYIPAEDLPRNSMFFWNTLNQICSYLSNMFNIDRRLYDKNDG